MNSATAAAAVATVSIRLGKLNSVVSTVNPYARPLRKPLREDALAAFCTFRHTDQESEGLTRGESTCQERPTSFANAFSVDPSFLL